MSDRGLPCVCPKCNGAGVINPWEAEEHQTGCKACGGTGEFYDGNGTLPCPQCHPEAPWLAKQLNTAPQESE